MKHETDNTTVIEALAVIKQLEELEQEFTNMRFDFWNKPAKMIPIQSLKRLLQIMTTTKEIISAKIAGFIMIKTLRYKLNCFIYTVKLYLFPFFLMGLFCLLVLFLIHNWGLKMKSIYVDECKEQINRDNSKTIIFEDYFLLVIGNNLSNSIIVYHKVFDDIDALNPREVLGESTHIFMDQIALLVKGLRDNSFIDWWDNYGIKSDRKQNK